MSHFSISTADKSDEAGLRNLLASTPLEGEISLTFQRQPNYFYAAAVEGKFNQTVVVRQLPTKKIVGLGSRSVKPAYLNGEVKPLGYLSSLRINKNYRKGIILSRGYKYLHQLHQDNKVKIYLTTIIEDNVKALELLTSKRAGLPAYNHIGSYFTFLIKLIAPHKILSKDITVVKGVENYLEQVVECLQRNGQNKQFYPYYTKDDFIQPGDYLRGFSISDFYLALKGEKVVGVLGKWDQGSFKQAVISGYKGRMRRIRPVYNLAAKILGHPLLPDPGLRIKAFYISFIAVDSNDPDIFSALLNTVYNDSLEGDYSYMIVGLSPRDSLGGALRKYPHLKYKSQIFVVCWDDGSQMYNSLDKRIPYLEAAAL